MALAWLGSHSFAAHHGWLGPCLGPSPGGSGWSPAQSDAWVLALQQTSVLPAVCSHLLLYASLPLASVLALRGDLSLHQHCV